LASPRLLRTIFEEAVHVSATLPGGDLEQIQFLLGHVPVQTTEKYLGCKQRLREAVNDRIGIEPTT
jgi:site-specific recombinase XerD